jgi:hypothetical protein
VKKDGLAVLNIRHTQNRLNLDIPKENRLELSKYHQNLASETNCAVAGMEDRLDVGEGEPVK